MANILNKRSDVVDVTSLNAIYCVKAIYGCENIRKFIFRTRCDAYDYASYLTSIMDGYDARHQFKVEVTELPL